MFNPDHEIYRLTELMPASGRMMVKVMSRPDQRSVLEISMPLPWQRQRPIHINFDRWQRLSVGQRDLMALRSVQWLLEAGWFKTDIYQGVTAVGVVAALGEFFQGDLVGLTGAGGLAVLGGWQVWRVSRSPQKELEADEAGIRVAVRRGYAESEAARHLLEAIETIARLEGRKQLTFGELLRLQNLKTIAGLSNVGIPQELR